MVSGCGFLCSEKQNKNLAQKSLRTWITDYCQQIRLSKRRFCGMDLLLCTDRNQNKQEDKTVLIPTPLLWRFVVRVTRSEFPKFPLFHLKAINRIFPRPNKVFLVQQTCYQADAGEDHFWSFCRSLNCVKTLTQHNYWLVVAQLCQNTDTAQLLAGSRSTVSKHWHGTTTGW